MAGNSQRKGAMRKEGTKKGMTVGSGGQRRKGLKGKGPTPKAEERTKHPAARRARAAGAEAGLACTLHPAARAEAQRRRRDAPGRAGLHGAGGEERGAPVLRLGGHLFADPARIVAPIAR